MATLDVLTLPEAKEAVKLTGTNEEDAELVRWVTAVSLRLDQLVGPVVRRTVTDELDGGDCSVFLSEYPAASVTSVTEYDRLGAATVLTRETSAVKPVDGYLLRQYSVDYSLHGNEIRRRAGGYSTTFADGEGNVVVVYTAGRFTTTTTVDERFKRAAALLLKNVWRAEQESAAEVGEFDVPMSNFPMKAVTHVVRDLFPGELQGHYI